MDYLKLDFDFDGDGLTDTTVEGFDTNNDGMIDELFADLDGNASVDTVIVDTDGDGVFDQGHMDLDGDGYTDIDLDMQDVEELMDLLSDEPNYEPTEQPAEEPTDQPAEEPSEQPGDNTSEPVYEDTDGDGIVDTVYEDTDGDGVFDTISQDTDKDGYIDRIIEDTDRNGSFETDTFTIDTDGDGIADTVQKNVYMDIDGDGEFDFADVYIQDESTGDFNLVDTVSLDDSGDNNYPGEEPQTDKNDLVEIEPVFYDENDNGTYYYDLDNFDPSAADMDNVVGDPGHSMEFWEYQGETNRCALYSQKFMIEELTGQDIDIEEFADIAEENGWFSEEGGTPIMYVDKMLEYYGLEPETTDGNSFSDLAEALNNGEKVLIGVDSEEYWFGENDGTYTPGDSPNHAVEVVGIDYSDPENPMVILNDSGNPDGCGCMIPYQTFMDAWEDSNYMMVTCDGQN